LLTTRSKSLRSFVTSGESPDDDFAAPPADHCPLLDPFGLDFSALDDDWETPLDCGAPRECGAAPRECGAAPRECGAAPRDCGAAPRDWGAAPRDCGDAPRDCGAAPRDCGAPLCDCATNPIPVFDCFARCCPALGAGLLETPGLALLLPCVDVDGPPFGLPSNPMPAFRGVYPELGFFCCGEYPILPPGLGPGLAPGLC